MKRLVDISGWAVALAALTAHPVYSEPSQSLRTLMNTPVSLFSFGIFQLQTQLRRAMLETSGRMSGLPPDNQKFEPEVEYNWDRNQLIVNIYDFRSDADKKQDSEEECRSVMAAIREFFGINPETGKLYHEGLKSSYLNQYFIPLGYSMNTMNDKLFSELDANTMIALHNPRPTGAGGFDCEGQLLDTGYSVKKQ